MRRYGGPVTYAEALAYLDSLLQRGIAPGLERMRTAMDLLAEPQRTYDVVHVTGTNGKTSVARAAAAILSAAGLRTGLYTSPHLDSVTERVAVDGTAISPAELAEAVQYLLPILTAVEEVCATAPTYFEAVTVLALQHFAAEACAAAVLEVGLGGTHDATNVADGVVAVVTNVAVDHVGFLGSDPAGIAAEKVGIVKAGAVAVTGIDVPELLAVLERRCDEVGAAALWRLGEEVRIEAVTPALGGLVLDVATPGGSYRDVEVPLMGGFQAANTALAIAAAEAFLGRSVDASVLSEALAGLTAPGRLEVVAQHPLTVVDGAHNPAGVAALLATLREVFHFDDLLVVCGVLGDKDVDGIVGPLAAAADRFYATAPDDARAADLVAVANAAEATGTEVLEEPGVAAAVAAARDDAGPHDMVLVTGSLMTVSEARPSLSDGPDPHRA